MKFSFANVRSVKADVANGVITIAFTVPMIDLGTAEDVAKYCDKDAGKVAVEIVPMQLPMKLEAPSSS
jgi:hypothetical protein